MKVTPAAEAQVVRAEAQVVRAETPAEPMPPGSPRTWNEYCDCVRKLRPAHEDQTVELVVHCLELSGLVGALDWLVGENGYNVFTDDALAHRLLGQSAAIFLAATALQDDLGCSMLRARPPGEPALVLNSPSWLQTDVNAHQQFQQAVDREFENRGEQDRNADFHEQLYEQRMNHYVHIALATAAWAAAGVRDVLVGRDGARRAGAAQAAYDCMAAVEHMLVVNGFTAEDAVILSLEKETASE